MKITELYIKNFGRFSEQHFYIKDGVQVIYGENEYGKSTLQAFIKAMLFGMERGRGKAAVKDDFSKYQPWENPNYYAGVMRFRCGDRISKQVSLVCEDDGEELSVEHGDLDILLGGITPGMYDNTVLIGQFQSRPGQELAESLKNYAANYYETGGGELDLSGAISDLKERKKAVEQQCRSAREQREKKYLSMEQECTYLEKDMRKFQAQYEENQQRIRLLQQRQKENDSKETDLHPGETESASEQPEENSRGMIIGGFLGAKPEMFGFSRSGSIGNQVFNTIYLVFISLLVSVPIGVLAGIYLAMYAKPGLVTRFLRTCIETLSSLPSIVVGLFGYLIFLVVLGLSKSLLAGALSISILSLPLITTTTEDAIKGLPEGYYQGSMGLGATKWQTIFHVLLPACLSRIMTGVILAAGRGFGEAAVLLYTTGSGSDLRWNNFSFTSPTSPINVLRPAETLSIQIWNLQTNGQDRALANLSSAVLMILVLAFSIGANIWSRHISKKQAGFEK